MKYRNFQRVKAVSAVVILSAGLSLSLTSCAPDGKKEACEYINSSQQAAASSTDAGDNMKKLPNMYREASARTSNEDFKKSLNDAATQYEKINTAYERSAAGDTSALDDSEYTQANNKLQESSKKIQDTCKGAGVEVVPN